MEIKNHAAWIKQIVDFIGEYSGANPGYSPQALSAELEKNFGIRPDDAAKLALLIEQEISNKLVLASIELNLTFNCNLACEYCFVHNKSPEDRMTFATAQKAIDLLMSYAYPNVTITLFGGEPLLEFELIKKIVPYALESAQKHDMHVQWAITTNGTLINEEMLRFFAQYGIMLLLSMDGGPVTHDRYRRTKCGEGTWQKIAALVPLLKQYQGWLGTRMTVSTEAVGSMREDFKQLVELGINQFIISPAQGAKCWSKEQIELYGSNLAKICQDYLELKQAGVPIFIEEFEADDNEQKGWGCRAGVTSLAVAPNGDISPCSKLLGLTGEAGKCIVGNVHSGIDYKRLDPFLKSAKRQPEHCKQCANICTGGCYAVNFEQTGNHFTPSEEACQFWNVKMKIPKLSTGV